MFSPALTPPFPTPTGQHTERGRAAGRGDEGHGAGDGPGNYAARRLAGGVHGRVCRVYRALHGAQHFHPGAGVRGDKGRASLLPHFFFFHDSSFAGVRKGNFRDCISPRRSRRLFLAFANFLRALTAIYFIMPRLSALSGRASGFLAARTTTARARRTTPATSCRPLSLPTFP